MKVIKILETIGLSVTKTIHFLRRQFELLFLLGSLGLLQRILSVAMGNGLGVIGLDIYRMGL